MKAEVLQDTGLSPLQKRVWTLQKETDSFFNECTVVITGELNRRQLEESTRRVVAAHDNLRTAFVTRPLVMYPMQVVQDEPSLTTSLHQQDTYIHQLRLSIPAMCGDHYTLYKIAQEICENYVTGTLNAREDELQYGQFSDWQNDLLTEPAEAALDFWKQYAYRDGNSFTIPFAGHRVAGGAFKPAFVSIPVSTTADKQLLMACFAILLKQLATPQELTMGYVSEGRQYEELESTMGLLSRSIPVRFRCKDDMTLHTLVNTLQEEVDKVSEWQEYFDWGRENDSNARNYFHALFEYNKCNTTLHSSGDLHFRLSDIVSITDKFDLKLDVLETEDGCRLRFAYNSGKLSREAVETLARHFAAIVNVASGDKTVAEIMRSITITGFPFPVEINAACKDSIVSLFETTARRNVAAIAVQHGGAAMSYKVLNEAAGKLATHLRKVYSLKAGDIAAFCLERSEKLPVVMLGILKTGAAYLPVDVRSPQERISYMMEDSGAKVLITDKMFDALALDDLSPLNDEKIDPSSAAYVIYTSGSTGKPKGVMISHASLVNYVNWFISKYDVTAADSTLLFSSVAFDLCYTTFWSSIIAGARMCIHQETEYLDPVEFTADLIENNITFIKLTPSHFSLVAKDPLFDEKIAAYSLRLIVLGGEPIAADDVERYLERHPNVQFVNHYGPTETTIGVLTYDIDINNIKLFRSRPVIGRPIANTQAFVFAEGTTSLCVPGEIGEICILGNGVGMGYLNRHELTAEKFVSVSGEWLVGSGEICYRTGDLGRWMPDGTIEFLGRKDFQVKIRGHRIEAGEIEHTITSFAGVTDTIVQVVPQTETGEPQLIAFIKSPEGIAVKALEKYMRERLPHYMIPSQLIVLKSFPLFPNGKINRGELLKEATKQHKRVAYTAPRNNTEETLAGIWSEVLSVERPGVQDDFFELGGHSLKAAQLVSRIYKTFGKKVQLKEIFDHPTIGQVAVIISTAEAKKYEPIVPVPKAAHYEMSHAQKRLWILDHFSKDKTSGISPNYYRITGDVHAAELAESFRQLIERHEAFRTSFVTIDGMPRQQVQDVAGDGFRMDEIDLRDVKDPFAEAEQIALAEAGRPFDLTQCPLLRVSLVRTGDKEYVLVCVVHHIISDGWSLRLIFEELLDIYEAQLQGKEHSLPPLKIQYKDYAAWHNKRVNEEEAYWMRKLSNYPNPVNLPYDENPEGYIRYSVALDITESRALREIARKYNTTLSNLVLGIYGLFIHQVSGQDDILIGVTHANRNHEDSEKIIGFFVNLVVMRMQFSGDDTLEQLIKRLSNDALEAFGHSDYPFDLLVEKLCSNRQSGQDMLNVAYDCKTYNDILLGNDDRRSALLPAIEPVSFGEHTATYDLILHVVENEDHIMYDFEYKQHCFSIPTVQQFYNIFGKLLTLAIKEL